MGIILTIFFGGLLGLALLVGLVGLSGLRIAREYERAVVFRLGRYVGLRGPGLWYKTPFIESYELVSLRTCTWALSKQETITKDSVTVQMDAVLWYRVVEPNKAILSVADYGNAILQTAVTTLRNIVGQHVLDEILKERDKISAALVTIVDAVTETWGVKIERVEMRDIQLPDSMQRAMAQEAEAIREKRARIIKAEGEFEASQKLSDAAKVVAQNPISLELRRMQMITEVGSEQNTTTIVMMPSQFVDAAAMIARGGKA